MKHSKMKFYNQTTNMDYLYSISVFWLLLIKWTLTPTIICERTLGFTWILEAKDFTDPLTKKMRNWRVKHLQSNLSQRLPRNNDHLPTMTTIFESFSSLLKYKRTSEQRPPRSGGATYGPRATSGPRRPIF